LRIIDDRAIAEAGLVRRRSEYHYCVFEYLRSPKILQVLDKAGVGLQGRRVLDAGCGSGGTTLSFAEESALAVGIDIRPRFRSAGTRLAQEKGIANARFAHADGVQLPFRDAVFDVVLCHEVVEHVSAADGYLRECHRVLRPGGFVYLSTAPYLSLIGAHLPRLRVPIPLHLLLGRRAALRIFHFLANHATWTLRDPPESCGFVQENRASPEPLDSLKQLITVRGLRASAKRAGFRQLWEDLRITGFFNRTLPGPLRRLLARTPWTQDVMTGQMQYLLQKP
jgi:SAM-dependent methyltransferase